MNFLQDRKYKFVYLWYYAIVVAFIGVAVATKKQWIDAPSLYNLAKSGLYIMGLGMILSLFSFSFVVNSEYKGNRTLNGALTIIFSSSLFIIDIFALLTTEFGYEQLFKTTLLLLCIWIIAFLICCKKLVKRNKTLANQ